MNPRSHTPPLQVGIVSNRGSADDWDKDFQMAKAAGIDGFALNIGVDDFTDTQLKYVCSFSSL